MKKVIALSTVLGLSALGMASGSPSASQPRDRSPKSDQINRGTALLPDRRSFTRKTTKKRVGDVGDK